MQSLAGFAMALTVVCHLVLQIAGSRASKEPEMAGFVFQTLQNAMSSEINP